MTEVALRDLRNNTSELLQRVEAGEELTVTVSGRPVAQIVPLARRPRALPWQQVLRHQADPGMADDIRQVLAETTDEDKPEDPWERAVHQ